MDSTLAYTQSPEALRDLRALNARFIHNFVTNDVPSHDAILHPDFICLSSNGMRIDRASYLKRWATCSIPKSSSIGILATSSSRSMARWRWCAPPTSSPSAMMAWKPPAWRTTPIPICLSMAPGNAFRPTSPQSPPSTGRPTAQSSASTSRENARSGLISEKAGASF